MKKALYFIPVGLFLVVGLYFFVGLSLDPNKIPSVLIDRPVPEFDLPPVAADKTGLTSDDLRGEVSLVNIFGSWCAACRIEHPFLMHLSENNIIPIYGIDWRDKPGDGAKWLARFGDPYSKVGDDQNGRVAIDFGVTGAPETFIVDRHGHIRYKHVGPIDRTVWQDTLWPIIEELRAE